jgi:hypothetical protein
MAEETKTEVAQPEEGTVTTPQSEAPNLTVADLRNIRAIIDISSQRGAFRGAELKTVGEVFDKLDGFLKAVDAKAQAESPKEGDAPAEANTEEK